VEEQHKINSVSKMKIIETDNIGVLNEERTVQLTRNNAVSQSVLFTKEYIEGAQFEVIDEECFIEAMDKINIGKTAS
jgi:hypothetical protein